MLIYDTATNLRKEKSRIPVMGELIPTSFVSLIQRIEKRKAEMQETKQLPIINKEEFDAIVKENSLQCRKDIQERMDVHDATVFLRERGMSYTRCKIHIRQSVYQRHNYLKNLFKQKTILNRLCHLGLFSICMLSLKQVVRTFPRLCNGCSHQLYIFVSISLILTTSHRSPRNSHYTCSLCRLWPVFCIFWLIKALYWLFF